METIKPGQFVELTYDLFVGSENELMESATAEAPFQFVFGVDQMLPSFESHIKDLKEGMILKGTVRNVIDFGAFVDIGVHQDGLVHISQMSEKFIKHPLEAVSVGDVVEVRVLGVDEKKNRISLSMKGLNK